MLEAKTLTGKFRKKSLNIALTCVYLSTHTHTQDSRACEPKADVACHAAGWDISTCMTCASASHLRRRSLLLRRRRRFALLGLQDLQEGRALGVKKGPSNLALGLMRACHVLRRASHKSVATS